MRRPDKAAAETASQRQLKRAASVKGVIKRRSICLPCAGCLFAYTIISYIMFLSYTSPALVI